MVKFWVGLDSYIEGLKFRLGSVFKVIVGRDYFRFWLSGSKLGKIIEVLDRDNIRLFFRKGIENICVVLVLL